MLDKQSASTESAPVRRLLRFFGLENRRDKESPTANNRPPKEPEERKHQFAVWYFFAAFLGVMLIQYLWVSTRPFRTANSSSSSIRTKSPRCSSGPTPSKARSRSRSPMAASCSAQPVSIQNLPAS